MTWRSVGVRAAIWGLVLAAPLSSQETTARADSVTVRFVDVDVRAVVQSLAQYLDRPVLFAQLPAVRTTIETPRPIPREQVLSLLKGVLTTHQLTIELDSAGGFYRVTARAPEIARAPVPDPLGVRGSTGQDDGVVLFSIRLKHAKAADVAATVNALYGRSNAVGELGGTAGRTLSSALRDNRAATMPGTGGVPSQAVMAASGLAASLTGDVTIVPDPRSNALMIRASRRDFQLIKAAVEELDVRPLQVMIEVLIAEARKDRGFSLGVGASVPTTPIRGGGNATASGSTTGLGLGDFAARVMGLGGVDLDVTLRAAAAKGDVTIASRPVVLAANNELAEILVGSQRPFIQVSRSLPTDAPQRDQVVQYKDVGTRLSVRPTISGDGYVMLEVIQEVNAVTSETAFDAPVISTRSVQTRLLVRDGKTAVIGGLSDRQRDANSAGVPLLSRIPLIGWLFGRTARRATETELFLFLTPTVLASDEDLEKVTNPRTQRLPGERLP